MPYCTILAGPILTVLEPRCSSYILRIAAERLRVMPPCQHWDCLERRSVGSEVCEFWATWTCIQCPDTILSKQRDYTILHYTILYYPILSYTILYYTILYYTILYYTILYYTILHYTILYYTTLHYTTLYFSILGTSEIPGRSLKGSIKSRPRMKVRLKWS